MKSQLEELSRGWKVKIRILVVPSDDEKNFRAKKGEFEWIWNFLCLRSLKTESENSEIHKKLCFLGNFLRPAKLLSWTSNSISTKTSPMNASISQVALDFWHHRTTLQKHLAAKNKPFRHSVCLSIFFHQSGIKSNIKASQKTPHTIQRWSVGGGSLFLFRELEKINVICSWIRNELRPILAAVRFLDAFRRRRRETQRDFKDLRLDGGEREGMWTVAGCEN